MEVIFHMNSWKSNYWAQGELSHRSRAVKFVTRHERNGIVRHLG
jgi:hypothetical protein